MRTILYSLQHTPCTKRREGEAVVKKQQTKPDVHKLYVALLQKETKVCIDFK